MQNKGPKKSKEGVSIKAKVQNRLGPTHALISTNFNAGSPNLAPEWRETAGNLDFYFFFVEAKLLFVSVS